MHQHNNCHRTTYRGFVNVLLFWNSSTHPWSKKKKHTYETHSVDAKQMKSKIKRCSLLNNIVITLLRITSKLLCFRCFFSFSWFLKPVGKFLLVTKKSFLRWCFFDRLTKSLELDCVCCIFNLKIHLANTEQIQTDRVQIGGNFPQ